MKNMQMIEYRKEGFFERIKNKITKIFSKKQEVKPYVAEIDMDKKIINKEEFLEIYRKVRKNEVDVGSLDKETLKKVLIMMAEELEINTKKINDKLSNCKNALDSARMYNKELEIAIKNGSK